MRIRNRLIVTAAAAIGLAMSAVNAQAQEFRHGKRYSHVETGHYYDRSREYRGYRYERDRKWRTIEREHFHDRHRYHHPRERWSSGRRGHGEISWHGREYRGRHHRRHDHQDDWLILLDVLLKY